jgi:phosphonate transport system substrate-binding protein
VSYTDAAAVADLEVFAAKTKNGQTTYRSLLIGNVAAGVTDLAKVRGKSVAWGDPKSTSSHLVPKLMLKQAGLSRNGDFKESFVGSHDQVAFTVEAGNNAQAGGLSQEIFESLVEEGKIDASKVKILKVSDPIPQYPWVMQAGLAPELKAKIREAFLSCTDKKIMKPLKAQGFAAIGDDAYGIIRELKSTLGNEADPRQ